MASDEDDDLFDEEFDFVDEDDDLDDDSDFDDESPMVDEEPVEERAEQDRLEDERARGDDRDEDDFRGDADDEPVDEYGRTAPAANYVVHVYEHKKFKRTIDRPFTPEDAEAFATEFNRTAKSYGRVAVSGKNDATPKKALE